MLTMIIAILVAILDQITKIYIRSSMSVGHSKEILSNFFYITHHENKGISFSLLEGNRIFLIVIPVITLFGIIGYIICKKYKKEKIPKLLAISLGLILGGAIGNFIDRWFFAQVTDMIYFTFFPAIFNIADTFIVFGFLLLLIDTFLEERKEVKKC